MAIQELAKQMSNFMFAQRQPHQQRNAQRQDSNVGKTAELTKKGERGWKRIENQAREKLSEIRAERERQMEERILSLQPEQNGISPDQARADWEDQIQKEFVKIEDEIQKAMNQEKEYERCDYRRTNCKALQKLISKHNSCKQPEKYGKYEESNCTKYLFNQYGDVESTTWFLVDPDRFWNYDLKRCTFYSERPL